MKYIVVGLLLLLHLLLLMNLQFTVWPEMLSIPYLRNNGYLLYVDIAHPYPPVVVIILAYIYKIFGYGEIFLKIFTWFLLMSCAFLVWLLTRKLTKSESVAIFTLLFYVLVQPILEGNMMWPDIAIIPPLLLGSLFFMDKKYLFAGFFFALAGFIKQTGGLFYITILFYLLLHKTKFRNIQVFLLGPIFIGIPLIIGFLFEGSFQAFLEWVIIYPSLYWSKFPGYVQFMLTKSEYFVTGLLLIPGVFLLVKHKIRESQMLFIFLALSLLSVYPRFSFFHLQSLIAFSSISYGYIFYLYKGKTRLIILTLAGLLLLRVVPFARFVWGLETRFLGKQEHDFSTEIKKHTDEKNIFLQGMNSNFYVLTNTLPPKPWLDNFGWYWEMPGVKERTLSRWEQNSPKVVFWRKPNTGNWYDLGVYQPDKLVEYIKSNYVFDKNFNNDVEIWKRKI